MRCLRVAVFDQYYLPVLDALYEGHRGLEDEPYERQLQALMELRFGTSDAYVAHLRALGHEAHDVVLNCIPLQARWAREHHVAPIGRRAVRRVPAGVRQALAVRFLHAVAHAQIEALDPEVLYLQDFWFFTREEMRQLKRQGRRIVGQLGSHPPDDGRVEECDLVLTSFPHFVERLRDRGIRAEYFAIAFDERLHDHPSLRAARDVPISFVGTIHPPDVHRAGRAFFERLCQDLDLQLWGYVNDELAPGSPIRARHHGEAWGLDMYRVLARSRIVVNRHGDIAEDYANNMRLFEATGMGALLMTESARNLPGLFGPGVEVVTYDDLDDLEEKARHYMTHDDERDAIAAAGQRRTLAEHTYRHRIGELDEILRTRLA
jgi:spore maturation protein CgeB